ncbi:hypothetical protein C0581_05275 [Candidatus Parcubacteria bacterium]|nr:MAG: hypothetical protein C0581_05275 [Candidatus Parcubacteria bacterium]
MNIWKIILVSFVITLTINLIPIKRNFRVSMECPVENKESCFMDLVTYGFPIANLEPNIWNFPAYQIDWRSPIIYVIATILFIPNWIIYLILLKLIVMVQNRRNNN